MKLFLYSCILCLFLGCSKTPPQTYIPHLNGYWEIHEVILADGSKKTYPYSNTIDYIKLNDSLLGYRKKLMPKLDGSFNTTQDQETLKAIVEHDSLNLYYNTPFANWKETVLKANPEELILVNTQKVTYIYKRYKPLKLD